MKYHKEIAAATAIVGADLITGEKYAKEAYARVLREIACTGSTAVGDTIFEVKVAGVSYGTFVNIRTGLAANRDDYLPALVPIPANQQLQLVVVDAANTNPITVELVFQP